MSKLPGEQGQRTLSKSPPTEKEPPDKIGDFVRIDGDYDPIYETEAGWTDEDFDYGPNPEPVGKDHKPITPFG